ncbi:ROK family protein [Bacteriovorax sp. Seq25_V]|uniref:ROK family protein n=1 Tax=Bacteriovorax sp. Seq25_V TaxID=1201288 RepID=UPI00038A3F6B|nr:ROK family protein [Bacteriovorax sp. Seq25_V]EQC43821.1 ROK family protein [Bacteriovorax sp. Seq25_V]
MSSSKKSYTIGIDLGGTKLAAGLIDGNGTIIEYIKVPTDIKQDKSPKVSQKRLIALMTDIAIDIKKRFPKECNGKNFKGIGLASAGPLNVETGSLINPVNFKGWKTVAIRELLKDSLAEAGFKTPIVFQNDAIASAYAEGWHGLAKDKKSYAVITVGTGIGTGIILNDRPCQTNGMGSEFGHMLVDIKRLRDTKDNYSLMTVEGIASGTGLIKRSMAQGFNYNSVEELVLAHKQNGNKHEDLFDDMSAALAMLCFNLSIGFNLEGIYISGGLIKIKDLFLKNLKAEYARLIKEFNPSYKCSIDIAGTKNFAGVIGAAYLPYTK